MPVVKDSLFVEAVWNIIFENVKNCLFSCYYKKSNLTKLRNPILFRLNFFADGFLMYHKGLYFMSFVLSNLHINNQSNDVVSTIKQFVEDTLLSVIAHNGKN